MNLCSLKQSCGSGLRLIRLDTTVQKNRIQIWTNRIAAFLLFFNSGQIFLLHFSFSLGEILSRSGCFRLYPGPTKKNGSATLVNLCTPLILMFRKKPDSVIWSKKYPSIILVSVIRESKKNRIRQPEPRSATRLKSFEKLA